MKLTVDTSELNQLTADLSSAPRNVWPNVFQAVEVTARHIKDDWNEGLGGGKNTGSAFKHIGRSVDYDIGPMGGIVAAAAGVSRGVEADIGPNLARLQGSMAGWFEEGMRNIPALHPGHAALKKNEQDFLNGLQKALADSLAESL